MFENVTYDFYTETLGRSAVPDAETFDGYALENKLAVKRMYNDGLIAERETNGIDSAVCMMIEEDYLNAQTLAGEDALDTSESIGGYSHGADTKAYDIAVEKNAKSLDEKKYKWLGLYCDITSGVR